MAWNRTDTTAVDASATAQGALNHIDMLEKLRDMAINQSATVNNPTIANGGTGYSVGDIVEITDGAATETFPASHPATRATYEVTAETGGVVDSVRLRNAGVYTALPTNNGTPDEFNTTALSGGGDDALNLGGVLFASNGWAITRETSEVTTATVNDGGSGYVATDTVTLIDGGNEVVAAGVTIDTVGGGGEILTFTIDTGGVYNILPATLSVAGGSGSGGILNITAYTAITDQTVERELIMTAASTGAIVGFRTDTNGTYYSWETAGLVSFTAVNSFPGQVDISPGRFDVGDGTGQFVFLRDTDPARWNWMLNITDRRIWGAFNIDNAIYNFMYLGLGNPHGTAAEYSYPFVVGGCSSRISLTVASGASQWAGLPHAVGFAQSDTYGPCMVRSPGGTWEVVRNGFRNVNDIHGDESPYVKCFPPGWYDSGDTNLIAVEDQITPVSGVTDVPREQTWELYASVATDSAAEGADPPTDFFYPAEAGGGAENPVLWECVISGLEPSPQVYVELDDVRWVERTIEGDVFSAEDEIYVDGEVWVVLNQGALTTRQHWLAVKLSP